jgi:hypothetical protein
MFLVSRNYPASNFQERFMKTVPFEGTVEEYAGQKLEKPIQFSGNAEQYENVAEAKSSEDWPGDSEVLKIVNRSKVTSAKASAYQKATADLKKAYEGTDAFKLANLVKAIKVAQPNLSDAEANAMAETLMGK